VCQFYYLFSASGVFFLNDKIVSLRKAPTLWGIPNCLVYFAGVGASFTRALDKFTTETFQYLLFIMHIKITFSTCFVAAPSGAGASNEFFSKEIQIFILYPPVQSRH